jgi:hypothetical protein
VYDHHEPLNCKGFVAADVLFGGSSVLFVSTHFDATNKMNKDRQMMQLGKALRVETDNFRGKFFSHCSLVCLGGDFNICPQIVEGKGGGYDKDESVFNALLGNMKQAGAP